MNIVKLVDKYPKMMTSSVTLKLFKTKKILNKPELFSQVYFQIFLDTLKLDKLSAYTL